jgi:hypothetical protein
MVVLKQPFLGWRNNSVARLNSVFGLEKVDQKPYSSSIKLMETTQWDELRFSCCGSALDGETNVKYELRSGRPSTAPVPPSSWSLRQMVCSTFSRSGWSALKGASLAKGGTSKKRPSPHLHIDPTLSNKASPRTSQTALVQYIYIYNIYNVSKTPCQSRLRRADDAVRSVLFYFIMTT